jgi:hypothetical protein
VNFGLWFAWLRYIADRLAWPGLLGIALAIGASGVELASVAPIEESNSQLRVELAQQREKLAAAPEDLPAVETRSLAVLAGGAELVPLVSAVHASARRRQVALDQGEYALQREGGTHTARYLMVFPAHGTYPQLRGWAADVIARRPELVLEEFDFRRENIGSEQVEARVRFSARVEEMQS